VNMPRCGLVLLVVQPFLKGFKNLSQPCDQDRLLPQELGLPSIFSRHTL
jgi:hypothetical protein